MRYNLRFQNKFGDKFIEKQDLIDCLLKFNAQHLVADYFGVSQMTISRAKTKMGIDHDGKILENKDEDKIKSQILCIKEGYKTGRVEKYWLGKKQSEEQIENRVSKIRGKSSWNSGLAKVFKGRCRICHNIFEYSSNKGKSPKITCSDKCKYEYVSKQYSDGRLKGENNPMFGKGEQQKEAWKNGKYKDRPLPKHSNAKGGYYKNIWMRSSWEISYAKLLDELKLKWDYEPKRFHLSDGRHYTPDFYIENLDIYIEVKGWWWPGSKSKFDQVIGEFREITIIIEDNKSWKIPSMI